MRFSLALILSVFLLVVGSCKKPVLEVNDGTIPPLVLTTSVHDSLPQKTIHALNLEGVTGIKIQYYSGLYSKYFEYTADKDIVLNALSEIPFPVGANYSDTQCRPILSQALALMQKNISDVEFQNAQAFWITDEPNEEIFECIKLPFRHTVRISSDTRKVRHRIELLQQS